MADMASSDSAKTFADFIINCSGTEININKKLFNGIGTIDFKESEDEVSRTSVDFNVELVKKYVSLVELRRAMNFYFFVDGVMKDDVKEVSDTMKETTDFIDLFSLCETLGDMSMAFFASYFIFIELDAGEIGKKKFPLCFLRHFSGKYYAELFDTVLGDHDIDFRERFSEPIHLMQVRKLDLEYYYEICALRTKLNGKFMTIEKDDTGSNKLLIINEVRDFLDKTLQPVLFNCVIFCDYIGDVASATPSEFDGVDFHGPTFCCSVFIAIMKKSIEKHVDLKFIEDELAKPYDTLFKVDDSGGADESKGDT